jgi:hypothetical protein
LPSVPRWSIFEAKSSFRSPKQTSTDS